MRERDIEYSNEKHISIDVLSDSLSKSGITGANISSTSHTGLTP